MTEQRTVRTKKISTQLIFGKCLFFFSLVILILIFFFVFHLRSASLQKQLDDLDKTLYKDLIRQGKLNQMQQKRDRSILGGNHLRGLHKQKSSRRKLKKENSGNLSSAVSRGDISGSDKDSDTRSIKTDKSDSKLSSKRRITFEDLNKHSMSHRSSRTSHQSEETTKAPIKGAKSGNDPDSIGVDREKNKTDGNLHSEFNVVEKDCQENLDKMENTGLDSSVNNSKQEPEEDEEEDDDEMDEDQVGEILVNKYVPVHLRHPFLSCLPNNPRDSILPTGSLSTEAVQDLANDKLRKMALVEEIFDEIMSQRQAMDPRHFRIDNLKKKKKTDTKLPEEENEEEQEDDGDVILNYNAEFQDLNIDSAKLVPQKTKIYYVSSINAVSRYVDSHHFFFFFQLNCLFSAKKATQKIITLLSQFLSERGKLELQ
jgi:hypothetical protein